MQRDIIYICKKLEKVLFFLSNERSRNVHITLPCCKRTLSLLLAEKLSTPRVWVILISKVSGQDSVLNAWLSIGIDADKKSGTQLLHMLGKCPNALFLSGYGRAPYKTE